MHLIPSVPFYLENSADLASPNFNAQDVTLARLPDQYPIAADAATQGVSRIPPCPSGHVAHFRTGYRLLKEYT